MGDLLVNILSSNGETFQEKPGMEQLMDENFNDNNGYFTTMTTNDPDYSVWLQFELSKEVIVKQVLIFNNVLQAGGTRNLLLRVGNIKVHISSLLTRMPLNSS